MLLHTHSTRGANRNTSRRNKQTGRQSQTYTNDKSRSINIVDYYITHRACPPQGHVIVNLLEDEKIQLARNQKTLEDRAVEDLQPLPYRINEFITYPVPNIPVKINMYTLTSLYPDSVFKWRTVFLKTVDRYRLDSKEAVKLLSNAASDELSEGVADSDSLDTALDTVLKNALLKGHQGRLFASYFNPKQEQYLFIKDYYCAIRDRQLTRWYLSGLHSETGVTKKHLNEEDLYYAFYNNLTEATRIKLFEEQVPENNEAQMANLEHLEAVCLREIEDRAIACSPSPRTTRSYTQQ